ncbi:glycosyltransferase [Microbacterium marinilacus]|uniref:Glycosyl transferase n=1 Tax=Microbacterium marinilacus TaxID=415209 RepID=A0ABP7B8U4_9MICO|nr:glycosyltransferase [Microbacterium marinilacus]MBY0687216.1 glycosyl transferase [Microbacterium marinilacus]
MPPAVHAILVARSTPQAAAQLERTLDALRAQTRPVDALTIVVCGSADRLRSLIDASGAEGAIEAPAGTSFATAVRLGAARVPQERAVWLLAYDTAPEPGALAALSAALERAPSVAIAAPKVVDAADPSQIVSLGVSMTRLGRTVPLANGEYDQGQHDADDDVLGADVRGVLLRAETRAHLLPDPALAGADEGLDMGVRARLGGRRVALAPGARLHAPVAGMAGLSRRPMARAYAVRTAQLHRRLAYAPAWAVPLSWLSLLPLALWRSFLHLVAKAPARVPAEWAAALTVLVRLPAAARSRGRIRAFRSGSWAQIAPLRATNAELRERYDPGGGEPVVRRELRFFSGGGAWAVLAALVVGVIAFLPLLAWPVLGGGGLLPLHETVSGLWAEAAYGLRSLGDDVVSVADPFSALLAALGSLWPGRPSYALVLVWVLALPLAVLGGWFAATRVTERSGVRVAVGVLWALAPTFLAALVDGRPAAVLLHLLLPWLFFAASVAHRSWGASGAGSIVLIAVLACAPSLAPALAVLWAIALLLALAFRVRRGAARVLWLVLPSAVVFAPLVHAQLMRGTPWALLADPGRPWAGSDAAGPLLLALGIPTADPAGWGALLGWLGVSDPAAIASWAPVLLAPLGLLALAAPLTPRWRAGIGAVVIAAAGLAGAQLIAGVQVAAIDSSSVPVWPGAALSLAWLGVVAAAAVTLDAGIPLRSGARGAAVLATVCVAVVAVPALTAVARDDAQLTNGPASTLPAYVTARAADERDLGTFVLTAQPDGGLAVRVVWGATETLGGQSTLQATEPGASDADVRIAELTSDLVSASAGDVPRRLSELGVRFVLLESTADAETDASRTRRLEAITAIDQRAGFVRVGETAKGVLWRLDADPEPRAELTAAERATVQGIAMSQLGALLVALLLAVPTAASRREVRRTPRVVGRGYEEGNR